METINSKDIKYRLDNHDSSSVVDFKIKDSKVIGPLLFMDKIYNFNIKFENCTFDYVYFSNLHCDKHIYFDNCKFLDDFLVRGLYIWNLKFENSEFDKSIDFDYCDAYFLNFIKTESKNGINLSSGQINRLKIEPLNEKTHFTLIGKFLLIKKLSINSVSGVTVFSKNCIINNISLSGYFNVGSRLDFSNIINNDLSFSDLNNDGKIYISNIKPGMVREFIKKPVSEYLDLFSKSQNYPSNDEEIEYINSLSDTRSIIELIATHYSLTDFNNFIEDRYLEFRNFEAVIFSTVEIINSSLGILEIKNLNFELQYILDIQNSDLSSIKLINSKIPDIHVASNYLNYYYVYNDLYTSANKQNNAKDKIEYYKLSQRYLYKFLKNEASPKDRDKGSIVAIFISELFSSHGANWLKAILITITFSFCFFCLYTASLIGISISLTYSGFKLLVNIILTYLPQFINPLHKIDFMAELAELGSWSSLIDLLSRIITAVGLFEIIRSFRKHVRQ